jgi:hypothetical protein
MERTITLERLTRYLGATGQDVSKALELLSTTCIFRKCCTGFGMAWKWPCAGVSTFLRSKGGAGFSL